MKKSFKKLILTIFFIIIAMVPATSQAYLSNPFRGSYFQPSAELSLGSFFSNKDYLFDFGLGFNELGFDFSAMLNFSFRPYRKKVKFKESEHLFYQAEEKIYQISIDLEKRFYFIRYGNDPIKGKIGIYLMGKFGYFWGKYGGFKEGRNQTFVINPGAGFSWQFAKFSRLSLGYLYFKQNPFVKPHMILLRLDFFTNKEANTTNK